MGLGLRAPICLRMVTGFIGSRDLISDPKNLEIF